MPKPNPTFFWVRIGLSQIPRFAAQIQAHFGTFQVLVGSGCMDLAIYGLFKGSGTFFGAETTTQSSNFLPEPNPISFQVGLGWVWVRSFFLKTCPNPTHNPLGLGSGLG
jgi:hypothetical protein